MEALDHKSYRPWYRQKVAPSQLDVLVLCREALHAEGASPIMCFEHSQDKTQQLSENIYPQAA